MASLKEKLYLPWTYEEEHVEEMPINGETYVRPRLWGTKPNGDPRFIAEFSVPVDPLIVKAILAMNKLATLAQVRGLLK